jgi:DNA-binding MarR family transcriptional regulator
MTGLLDGLVRDGLVERVFDEHDRRSVSISLTDKGQAKLDDVMPDYYARLRACMAEVDEQSRVQLERTLELINHGLIEFSKK